MPDNHPVHACCQIQEAENQEPELLLLDTDADEEIRFRHSQPDGPAKEQHMKQLLLQLTKDFPNLTNSKTCIKFYGDFIHIIPAESNRRSVKEFLWNESFRYELQLNYSEKDNQTNPTQNYRTDCKHMQPDFHTMDIACLLDPEHPEPIRPEVCNKCNDYLSKYIQFPISVAAINTKTCDPVYLGKAGQLVAIRPCGDNPDKKTYLGIYIGHIPMMPTVTFNRETHVLTAGTCPNPAFWVLDLKKIVFGAESWWAKIESEDELKQITDEDISGQFYVKLLKDLKKDGETE